MKTFIEILDFDGFDQFKKEAKYDWEKLTLNLADAMFNCSEEIREFVNTMEIPEQRKLIVRELFKTQIHINAALRHYGVVTDNKEELRKIRQEVIDEILPPVKEEEDFESMEF